MEKITKNIYAKFSDFFFSKIGGWIMGALGITPAIYLGFFNHIGSFLKENPLLGYALVLLVICLILWLRLLLSKSRYIQPNNLSEKIQDSDLERMLEGFTYGGYFMYRVLGDHAGRFVAQYRGKEIENLSKKYYELALPVPKNSKAVVKFDLQGFGHSSGEKLFILNEKNQRVEIDIYRSHTILVDKNAKIFFRLEFGPECNIDNAQIMIFCEGFYS